MPTMSSCRCLSACVAIALSQNRCLGILALLEPSFGKGHAERSGPVRELHMHSARDVDDDLEIKDGDRYRAFCTKPDGACGVHAVFGVPNGIQYELADARRKAQSLLGPTFHDVCQKMREDALPNLHSLSQALWKDYLLEYFLGRRDIEMRVFVDKFRRNSPTRFAELQAQMQRDAYEHTQLKEGVRRTMRACFQIAAEPIIHRMAINAGMVPITEGGIIDKSLEVLQPVLAGQRYELMASTAYWSDFAGRLQVVGTQEALPADPPMHKYAALFDARPVFDNLRWSFAVQQESTRMEVSFRSYIISVR